jgi:uncharacterized membrane protein
MLKKIASIYTMLIASVLFTLILLLIRIMLTNHLTYIFYAWNLFLAITPLWISSKLSAQQTFNIKSYLLLSMWLLVFPNAPYIITDLFHFTQREPIPFWYDLLIVTTAAWNGLILGLVSILQVEQFLANHLSQQKLKIAMTVSFILCGFGVYLGRYLRFNSWDIIYNIDDLLYQITHRFIHPFQHTTTWGFTILFAIMIALFYYTIKALAQFVK